MKKIIWLTITTIIVTNSAQARWASIDDAPIKISYYCEGKVNGDGTTQTTIETQKEILKEPGRDMAYSLLTYNSSSEKVKILEAKTLYLGKEYQLNEKLIEDKPLASSPHGFDQMRQIMLAFPKAEIGAKVFLKYRITTTKVPLENFFATIFTFGSNAFIEQSKIKIRSQLPLHLAVNDPEKVLKITKDKEDNFHKLEIILTRPVYKAMTNEPASNVVNAKYLTWVSLSSKTKWEDLAAVLGIAYDKILKQPLPKSFAAIAEAAAKKSTAVEQINTVTALLNDKVTYLGDWRSIKGRLIPRDLEQVSSTQMGDCKDFAAATAAILIKLGYKAQFVLVRRGVHNFYVDSLPDLYAFNHTFLKVTNNQGKIYWIDPTNFQSMADGLFPDIADKKVLVLDPNYPSYEKTPALNPEHAGATSHSQIEILSDTKIVESGRVTLKNEEALALTGAALTRSEQSIKDVLFYTLSGVTLEEKNKRSMTLPPLNSRIVKDLEYNYSFEQDNRLAKTNEGLALELRYNALANLFDITPDYVADISVDSHPWTARSQTIIKNIKVNNVASLNKELKTPWLYAMRKCTLINGRDLQIDETLILYKNLIANEELKNPVFLKLKDDLEKDFKNVSIVFTRLQ